LGKHAARIHAGDVAKGKDPAKERRRSRATLGKLLAEDGPYALHLKERGLVNIKPALSSLRREAPDVAARRWAAQRAWRERQRDRDAAQCAARAQTAA
jgi:hypothetical protein